MAGSNWQWRLQQAGRLGRRRKKTAAAEGHVAGINWQWRLRQAGRLGRHCKSSSCRRLLPSLPPSILLLVHDHPHSPSFSLSVFYCFSLCPSSDVAFVQGSIRLVGGEETAMLAGGPMPLIEMAARVQGSKMLSGWAPLQSRLQQGPYTMPQ